jgi:hypothetical protein
MKSAFWTDEMRKKIYARLLKEFGPHREWAGSRSPIDQKDRFKQVLVELAADFSKQVGKTIKPSAVEQQMDWGITIQKKMVSKGHVRTFILNKAAALETNFISYNDLPQYMNVKREIS